MFNGELLPDLGYSELGVVGVVGGAMVGVILL